MSAPLTAERIAQIQARVDAATEGPWEFWPGTHGDPLVAQVGRGPFGAVAMCNTSPSDYGQDNARFIAHARSDIPALLAEVERLTAEQLSNTSIGDHRLTWQELCAQLRKEVSKLSKFQTLVADLDRNEHGRHQGDVDGGDPTGTSQGNPHLVAGQIIGYSVRGTRPYYFPGERRTHLIEAWTEPPAAPVPAPSVADPYPHRPVGLLGAPVEVVAEYVERQKAFFTPEVVADPDTEAKEKCQRCGRLIHRAEGAWWRDFEDYAACPGGQRHVPHTSPAPITVRAGDLTAEHIGRTVEIGRTFRKTLVITGTPRPHDCYTAGCVEIPTAGEDRTYPADTPVTLLPEGGDNHG